MTNELLIAVMQLYIFSIIIGICLGGLLSFVISLFRHKRSGAYELDV